MSSSYSKIVHFIRDVGLDTEEYYGRIRYHHTSDTVIWEIWPAKDFILDTLGKPLNEPKPSECNYFGTEEFEAFLEAAKED